MCFQGEGRETQFSSGFRFPNITLFFSPSCFISRYVLSVFAQCLISIVCLSFMSKAVWYLRGKRLVGSSTVQRKSFPVHFKSVSSCPGPRRLLGEHQPSHLRNQALQTITHFIPCMWNGFPFNMTLLGTLVCDRSQTIFLAFLSLFFIPQPQFILIYNTLWSSCDLLLQIYLETVPYLST